MFLLYTLITGFVTKCYKIDFFELTVVLLCILPLQGALASYNEYQQPFIHGILAFKDYYLLVSALFIYYLLKRDIISIKELEQGFMVAALISLAGFYILSLATNPAKYADTIIAGSQTTKGDTIYYRFNMGLIFYGTVYFFILFLKTSGIKHLILTGLFALYIFAFRLDRTSMLATMAALFAAWLIASPRLHKVWSLIYVYLPFLLITVCILMIFPSIYDRISVMFWDAFATLIGENDAAGQAKLRSYEAAIATRQVVEHPILGNGRVSNTWLEGAFDNFYRFFYPSDVGILGTVFVFGVPGTLVLYFPFLLALYVIYSLLLNGVHKALKNKFFISLVFYLFLLFVDGLSNGSQIIFSAQSSIATMAIYFIYQKQNALKKNSLF
ncbi:MAG: hypothetical protein KDC92_01050 [Bacteroidetes bacterium]|nr:hypothetical protein [Bacteroidota bacterium]